jgi:hypothetical protein
MILGKIKESKGYRLQSAAKCGILSATLATEWQLEIA